MTDTFRPQFLESIQKHQLTVIENSENVKIFRFADPNTISLSCTIIYAANTCTITGDMGHFLFGRVQNAYNFFLNNPAVFSFGYVSEKVLAQDTSVGLYYFDGDLAEKSIKEIISDYREETDEERNLEKLNLLENTLQNVDWSKQFEVDSWFYNNANGELSHLFDDTYTGKFERLTNYFIWCVQAIIYATRLFEQEFKND
ncbi:hypothetical protein [Rodentibacter genomosp. 2]|uniref:Uncharacterized protein n=1 Tax=Rodentibacter genomosp. 2 TaxID=1908266 RepID=A0A1V3JN99_9PAST|nr:hypothetical protein [Rodentibacter genomosp. 2]OOF58290.1 hypothetical protein BKK55_02655 [Rodentibacter genomosp. 2]